MKRRLYFSIIIACTTSLLHAQPNANGDTTVRAVRKIQPKIMVIPRVKDNDDMKAFYDSSMQLQIALSKINEALLKRGANIILFAQQLKQAEQLEPLNRESGVRTDYKSMVLQRAGSDIYVEAKLDVVRHSIRNANSVTVILEGYQNGTSNLLGSKVGTSNVNQTEDIGLLVMQAMDKIAESFLALMQQEFDRLIENGQAVFIEFSIAQGSKVDFDSETGPEKKLLSEVIEDWIQSQSVKGAYNSQGATANKMIFSDVRIPLRDPARPDRNFTGQHFLNNILRFIRSLGLQAKRELSTNNKLIITIQ